MRKNHCKKLIGMRIRIGRDEEDQTKNEKKKEKMTWNDAFVLVVFLGIVTWTSKERKEQNEIYQALPSPCYRLSQEDTNCCFAVLSKL